LNCWAGRDVVFYGTRDHAGTATGTSVEIDDHAVSPRIIFSFWFSYAGEISDVVIRHVESLSTLQISNIVISASVSTRSKHPGLGPTDPSRTSGIIAG